MNTHQFCLFKDETGIAHWISQCCLYMSQAVICWLMTPGWVLQHYSCLISVGAQRPSHIHCNKWQCKIRLLFLLSDCNSVLFVLFGHKNPFSWGRSLIRQTPNTFVSWTVLWQQKAVSDKWKTTHLIQTVTDQKIQLVAPVDVNNESSCRNSWTLYMCI